MKTMAKQNKQLTILFENIVMKAKPETKLIPDCHRGTEVNLVTALGMILPHDWFFRVTTESRTKI